MNGATPVTTSEEHQHQHQQPQNEPPPEHPRSPTSPLSIRHGELTPMNRYLGRKVEINAKLMLKS